MKEQSFPLRPMDSARINMQSDQDLQYWTKELQVSKEVLQLAIKNVGTSASAVRRHLKINSGREGFIS